MKYYFLILFTLLTSILHAQYQKVPGKLNWQYGAFDSALHMPVADTVLKSGSLTRAGAMVFKTSNAKSYIYNGSRWQEIGSSVVIDSSIWATRYWVTSQAFLKQSDSAAFATRYWVNSRNFVSQDAAYPNPGWITSLAWSKITGAPAFLTSNQTITLSGDVSGTGTTSIPVTLPSVNSGANASPQFSLIASDIKGRVINTTPVSTLDLTSLLTGWYVENNFLAKQNGGFWIGRGKLDSLYVSLLSNEGVGATKLATWSPATGKLGQVDFKNSKAETLGSINELQTYTGTATDITVNDTLARNNGRFKLIAKGSKVAGGDTLFTSVNAAKLWYRVVDKGTTDAVGITRLTPADGLVKKYPGSGNITDTGTIGISNNGIALTKLAQIPSNSILGNFTGSTANVTAIQATGAAQQVPVFDGSTTSWTQLKNTDLITRLTKDSLANYTGGAIKAILFENGRAAHYVRIIATGTNATTKYDTVFMAGGVAWLRVANTGNRYIYSSSFDNKWSSGLTGNADSGYSVVSTATSSLSGALRQTPGYQFVAQGSNSSAPAFTGRLRWVGEIGGNTWGNYVTLEGQTGSEAWSKMIRFWSGGLIYNDANANQTSILTPLIPGGTHTNEAYTFRLPYRNHNVLGRDQDTLALRSDTSTANPTHFATQYQLSQISGGSITVPGTANQIQSNNGSGALQASTVTADASGNLVAPTAISTSTTPAFAAFYANQTGVSTSTASAFNFYGTLTTAFRRAFRSNSSLTLGANNNYVATAFGGESQAKPTSGTADLWASVGIKPQIASNPTANGVFKRSGTLTVVGRTPATDLKLPDSVTHAARIDSGGVLIDMMARLDTMPTATTVALSDVRTLWINKASSAATWTLPRLAISRYLDLELVNPTANAITLNNANGTSIINPKASGGNVSSYTIPAYGAIRIHGAGDVSEWTILSISN